MDPRDATDPRRGPPGAGATAGAMADRASTTPRRKPTRAMADRAGATGRRKPPRATNGATAH